MSHMDIFTSQKEEDDFVDIFCQKHGLSKKQEKLLCKIQAKTHEENLKYLNKLPDEIIHCAIEAEKAWFGDSNEDGDEWDAKLIELVKKYWNTDGKLIC